MDRPVPDRDDVAQLRADLVEQLHQVPQRSRVIGEAMLVLQGLPAVGVRNRRFAIADALDQTARDDLFRVGVDHLVLD